LQTFGVEMQQCADVREAFVIMIVARPRDEQPVDLPLHTLHILRRTK
jgi:hypothetical protein